MLTSSPLRHRDRLRTGSRSFFAASLLLPRWVAEPATVLYAYCRVADDAIDESADPNAAYETLSQRLNAIYEGRPEPARIDEDFARLVRDHQLPRALPFALLDGFLWDAQGRDYESIDDLLAYATRVAGSVGVMMAVLMGVRERSTLARAANLGVAMQLTNIARDVAEDAQRGRLYLPAQWMRQAGLDPLCWRDAPASSPALVAVIARLLRLADQHYRLGASGVAGLPRACRFGVHTAGLLYAEIGQELLRRGGDPFSGRAVVPPLTKLRVLARAGLATISQQPVNPRPPLAQTAFLVDAVGAAPAGRRGVIDSAGVSASKSSPSADGALDSPRALACVYAVLTRLERADRRVRGQF